MPAALSAAVTSALCVGTAAAAAARAVLREVRFGALPPPLALSAGPSCRDAMAALRLPLAFSPGAAISVTAGAGQNSSGGAGGNACLYSVYVAA
jgi:hypothetical protein